MENINMSIITDLEGYELTRKYVEYFWVTKKFYSLERRYEMEDIVSELYIKFKHKMFFEKYNPATTSKKYFVMTAVRNSMIDMLRKYREEESLDKENEEGIALMDRIAGNFDLEESIIADSQVQMLIDALPDETRSKVLGQSPMMGECKMTHKVIAIHLMAGYSVKEIAQMFINPNNEKPVSTGSISKIIKEIREDIQMGRDYLALQ